MRTTVELPPELMRKAKAQAAARGESLKTLLTRAVAAELGRSTESGQSGSRVRLPLFGDSEKRAVRLTNQDLAVALSHDDVQHSKRLTASRKK